MLDAFAYCEKLLREEDKDRYLATLFAPADARPALFSLYAFDLETAHVARRVREPLAGEIRLQWWHDALSGRSPEQTSGHPVAAAFLETVHRHGLSLDRVLTAIDARRSRLYEEPLAGLDVLESFARATAGAVFMLAAHILNGGEEVQAERVANAAALAAVVDAEAGSHRYAENVLSAARDSLDRARGLIGSVPDRILPAFLPLALVNARLASMQRGRSPDLPQWRKQWILWRASKNLPRRLAP
jgi:15-cis-phytoene synthase